MTSAFYSSRRRGAPPGRSGHRQSLRPLGPVGGKKVNLGLGRPRRRHDSGNSDPGRALVPSLPTAIRSPSGLCCLWRAGACRSCLYIFEINALSVDSFAIIFSHSEGCLFTLLIVSFAVQKLLSLFISRFVRVFSSRKQAFL